ncbi:hypothetical protein E7T09_04480 [Deinococcus sp. KSM4-11]|uniref:hypothetical protein n=1 Tax=Deinococcus sp. KSM4-11 TaxID=2568654 RepID=UPI0010A4BB7D|nr:hypothetical protein [Deinococcus sp. KSM4-11]THF88467.1 hypothetical protein E7T09_04480 [Deinococcus sp. KSM4-11]
MAVAVVAVLGVGGLALASSLAPRKKVTGTPVGLPTSADPTLPVQQVGVATGYAGTQLIDTGPVNYDYIGPGWAYAGIRKDW